MALPTSYLTSMKNLGGILNSMVGAQAPERFTTRFLESLGYPSAQDRLIIGVLKSLKFLADDGKPTQRYFDFLDQARSGPLMAEAVRDAYSDLFKVNKTAQKLTKPEVTNKMKTLTQGQYSESVLDKMASTFLGLSSLADFEASSVEADVAPSTGLPVEPVSITASDEKRGNSTLPRGLALGGLVYNIELVLPESRDPKVYDALFESLRKHLA